MKMSVAFRKLRFLILLSAVLTAVCASPRPAAAVIVSGEIDHMFQASWVYDFMGENKLITYGMDPNTFTKFSGSFCNEKTGLALGANVNVNSGDNAIAKADRIMGYLGYKKTYLRYQNGALKGTFHWDGSVTPSMPRDGSFEQSLTHVDLLYRVGGIGFIGLGYTSYAMPVEVQTLYTGSDKAHQKNGTRVYDTDYKAWFYSFLFGFDTFSEPLVSPRTARSRNKGFGMYISAEDRIGFGSSEMGKTAVANAMALNPGLKPVTESFFSAILENDTGLGFRWFSPDGNIRVGLGYEVSFINNFNFSGAAEKPGDLGFDIFTSLLRHGPVARLYVKW